MHRDKYARHKTCLKLRKKSKHVDKIGMYFNPFLIYHLFLLS